MSELLSIEWLKIKKYRTFWVIAGLFIVLFPLFFYMYKEGAVSFTMGSVIMNKSFTFPGIWSILSYMASFFVYFLGCLVIILVTNEYVFKTNRQNVIDGWSKLDFLHAKVLLVLGISVIATLWLWLIGLIFGSLQTGDSGPFASNEKVLFFFIYTFNHLFFALLLGFLLKRSGLAIGMYFLYIMLLEFILKAIVNHNIHDGFGSFLPLESSDNLLPVPLSETVKKMINAPETYSNVSFVAASIIYILIYYVILRRYLMKVDWK